MTVSLSQRPAGPAPARPRALAAGRAEKGGHRLAGAHGPQACGCVRVRARKGVCVCECVCAGVRGCVCECVCAGVHVRERACERVCGCVCDQTWQ